MERDADQIVRRILDGEATLTGIMAEYHVAYPTLMRVYKAGTTPEQRQAVRRRNLLKSGLRTRFKKGQTSWNKGRKGWWPEGSEKGWFKTGTIRGQAARNYRGLGTITIRQDATRKLSGKRRRKGKRRRHIKVSETGPVQYRFIPYARYIWQQAHGAIPKGACIVHRDGDPLNDHLDNLMLMANRAKHLRNQLETIPGMLDKCRQRSAAACRRRKGIKLPRPVLTGWDCQACGHTVDGEQGPQKKPGRCIKCGSSAFEAILRKETA